MAWTIAEGLGWLPQYPDRVPHHRTRQPWTRVEPFASVTIPVPVIPGLLAFAPIYPDRVPHRHGTSARTELFEPLIFPDAVSPLSWLPDLPAQAPRHHAAQRPTICEPPPGELVVIAQRMAWAPRYPSRVPHRRPPNPAGETYTIPPEVFLLPCVDLVNDACTTTDFTAEARTGTDLLAETVTSSDLVDEGFC